MISIIIPYKNSMSFFKECIESILNQSYSNFQLILVNDHSDDHSEILAHEYKTTDERIETVTNKGNGIIDALITGSEIAEGNFITRMDSDDLMRNDKLELMRNQLISKGTGNVCVGGVLYFASKKKLENGYINYSKWLNELTYREANYSEIFKECTIPSPCWMIHRKDFLKINQFNDLTYPEDYDFAFRLWLNNLIVVPVKEKIHLWRDHVSRTSRTSSTYNFENFIAIKIKYLLKYEKRKKEQLILWGAGKKGKSIAKHLLEKKISFEWVTENKNKIGQNIYGKIISKKEVVNINYSKLIICAISEPTFSPPNNSKMNRFISFY